MAWTAGRTRTSVAAHKRWAAEVKKRANGRCQIRGPRCTGRAEHADHVVPVAEGGAEYDVANGQGACTPCHDDKTHEEAARGRRRHYDAAKRPRQTHPGLT